MERAYQEYELSEVAREAVETLGIVLMVVTCVRLIHLLACIYYDYRMADVPLTTVCTHVPGASTKSHRAFNNVEDLRDVAAQRDTNVDLLPNYIPLEASTFSLEIEMIGHIPADSLPTSNSDPSDDSPHTHPPRTPTKKPQSPSRQARHPRRL